MAPFTISVPPLTAAQHGSLALSRSLPSPRAPLPPPAAPLPPAAPAPPTAPPSRALAPAAPAPPARASEERKKEEAKEKREGVWRILVGQRSAGAEEEDAYLVQLVERGKKVRRTRTELEHLAPNLFAAFLNASRPPSPRAPPEVVTIDTLEDEDSVVAPASRAWKGKEKGESLSLSMRVVELRRKARGAKKAPEEEKIGASTSASGSAHEEEDAQSGTDGESFADDPSDEEEEEDGDDEDDSDFPQAKNLRRCSPKKPTRKSSRATRTVKAFDMELSEDEVDSSTSMQASRLVRGGRRAVESSASEDELMLEDSGSEERRRRKGKGRVVRMELSDSEEESEGRVEKAQKALKRAQEAAMELDADEEEKEEWVGGIRPQDQHRQTCAKCDRDPLSALLPRFEARKKNKKRGYRSRQSDDDLEDDTDGERERLLKLGAWMECGVCISSYHYGCLPGLLQKEFVNILKAEHEAAFAATQPPPTSLPLPLASVNPLAPEAVPKTVPIPKRDKIELDMDRTFLVPKCWACKKVGGRRCYECGVSGRKLEDEPLRTLDAPASDLMDVDGLSQAPAPALPLMFRCDKCKRSIHYECLPRNDDEESTMGPEQHAQDYFDQKICHQCALWGTNLEVILAWAEEDSLPNEVDDVEEGDIRTEVEVVKKRDEKTGQLFTLPSAKDPAANAKYLVKWKGESYRQLDWVPHAFLAASAFAKLGNFLAKGSQVSFEPPKDDVPEEGEEKTEAPTGSAPLPDPNALDRIPRAWSTVDRVLDVYYKSKRHGGSAVSYSNYANLSADPEESIQLVSECYFKWGDLPYCESTTEAPPEQHEDGYAEYKKAYKAFLVANSPDMRVPVLNAKQLAELDVPRLPNKFKALQGHPAYITGQLKPFQIEGVNFMYYQWWQHKGCILADEMGLGKTVQIITLLSTLSKEQGARPFLVAVPNSTLGNWAREFERWAPGMRVVSYGGDAESRRIVEKFELFDQGGKVLKTHVILATYEALEKNISVFRKVARYDVLVVDEGQRLKSGKGGLLFSALQSINVNQRILLSGTPLNNNIAELFNLLHFINPSAWANVTELKDEFADLTPEKVEKIRELLKPNFLRRTKDLVLDLPSLTEIIVPVTVTPLQRQLYRSILERNAAAIESIFHQTVANTKVKVKKANFNNILMELRKLLGHPYLVSPDLEPQGVTAAEAHRNLTEASAKLLFLALLLPKLQVAGHRVLIFSQFKITLNILEDFLGGLALKYLRLDGDTPQLDRQRGIDKFNATGSEVFCYLLSTRAGGVGINLTTADTVLLFDADFNPQQDIQAISRAHRIGQTNPVRVFKLLVKGTVEEKIFNQGQRKLGLDHLIIQCLDAQDVEDDVEGILQYGAAQIFDDSAAESAAIHYTPQSIDALLARVADPTTSQDKSGSSAAFAHAKIWEVERGALEDVEAMADEPVADAYASFWQRVLAQQEEAAKVQQAAAEANVGRGKRKRLNVAYNAQTEKESPAKKKGPSLSSGDEFGLADDDEDSGDDDFHARLTKDDRLIDPHAPAGPRKLPSAVSVSRSASGTPQPLIPLHLGHPESSKSGKLKQKSKPKPSPMALGNLRQAQDPQVAGPSRRSSSNLLSRSPSYLQAVGSSRPSSNACHLPSSPANLIAEQKRLAEIHGLVVAAQVLRDAELDKLIAAAKGTPPGEQSQSIGRATKRVELLIKSTRTQNARSTPVTQRASSTTLSRTGPAPLARDGQVAKAVPSAARGPLVAQRAGPAPLPKAGPPPAARTSVAQKAAPAPLAGACPPPPAKDIIDLTVDSDDTE